MANKAPFKSGPSALITLFERLTLWGGGGGGVGGVIATNNNI